jgi:hypothetical protein
MGIIKNIFKFRKDSGDLQSPPWLGCRATPCAVCLSARNS